MRIRKWSVVLLVLLLVLLLAGTGALLKFRGVFSGSDRLKTSNSTVEVTPAATSPPQGISGVREETFNIANGFARSFDGDDSVGWKNARNVQVRGRTSVWSDGLLTVSVGGGTLALRTTDPVRYHCFPAMAPGADGGAAVETSTLYTPIRDPGSVGRMVPLREAALNLNYSTPPTEKFYFS